MAQMVTTHSGGFNPRLQSFVEGRVTEMPGIYKILEVVGTSPTSFAEATKAGVAEAAKTVHHMDWLEVTRESCRIVDGAVQEFQVTMKIGFKVER